MISLSLVAALALTAPVTPAVDEPAPTRDAITVVEDLGQSPARASRSVIDTIRGTVTLYDQSEPNTTVCAFDADDDYSDDWCDTTDRNGRYALNLPMGQYKIGFFPEAMDVAYEFYDNAATLDEATLVRTGRTVDAVLSENSRVYGTAPTADAELVCAFDQTDAYCTEVEGQRYEVYLDPGVYAMALFSGDEPVEWYDDSDTPQFNVEVAYRSTHRVDFDLSTVVTGTVSGAGTTFVDVYANDGSGWTLQRTTTPLCPTCSYREALAPGTYRLGFRSTDRSVVPRFSGGAFSVGEAADVVVREHRSAHVDADLSGAAITPSVIAGDQSVSWAQTRLLDASGRELASGKQSYRVPAGTYVLEASMPDSGPGAQKHSFATQQVTVQHTASASPVAITLPVSGYSTPEDPKPSVMRNRDVTVVHWTAWAMLTDRSELRVDGRTFSTQGNSLHVPGLIAGKKYTATVTVFNGDKSTTGTWTFTAPTAPSTATVKGGKGSIRATVDKTYGRPAQVQQRVGGKWRTVKTVKAKTGTIKVAQPGKYRLVLPKQGLFTRLVTPTVTVR